MNRTKKPKIDGMVGQRFGKWIVESQAPGKRQHSPGHHPSVLTQWNCRCDCGAAHVVVGTNLRNGASKGCRSCSRAVVDGMTGQQFGRYLVESQAADDKHGNTCWNCLCDCGERKVVQGTHLRSKAATQCFDCARLQTRLPGDMAARNKVLNYYKQNAIRRGHAWCLDDATFDKLTKGLCFYCGTPPSNSTTQWKSTFIYSGLDRVDNTKGYLEGNVVACCWKCNEWKKAMSLNDFILHAQKIAEKQNGH